MTRPPDPEAKTCHLIFQAKTEEEKVKMKAFKEICKRNGIEMRKELLKGIDGFLKEHHWPPGNSQVLIREFLPTPVGLVKPVRCHFCQEDAVGKATYKGKKKYDFCQRHLNQLEGNENWKVEEIKVNE